MKTTIGISTMNRIAIGPLHIYHRTEPTLSIRSSLTCAGELARFESAQLTAIDQLETIYQQALETVGPTYAVIFQIHQMMLEDDDYLDAVQAIIEERGATAEYAVSAVREELTATFAAMENAYMRARAADVQDFSHRLVNILTATAHPPILEGKPAILATDNLTPSEMMELDRERLLGFITRDSSPDSHAAILARTMGIPALMGVDFDDSWEGRLAALDGCSHCIYIDPTAELLDAILRK